MLGQGTYGTVCGGVMDGKNVAIKLFKKWDAEFNFREPLANMKPDSHVTKLIGYAIKNRNSTMFDTEYSHALVFE